MPSLFSLPKQLALSASGIALPGAKLYFFQTGTSTPQNTYQDLDLSTPHANPVVADAAGFFAPIYLDPSLPDYRVRLSTSADTQIWQLDDIPSNQNTAQQFELISAAPSLTISETDASTDNKKWRIRAQNERLVIETLNDAESSSQEVLSIARSGTGVGLVTIDGVPYFDSGSFTGTLTGYASNPTPTIEYRRTGNIVTLTRNAGSVATSNANSLTLTGIPLAIRPQQIHTVLTRVTDNGTAQIGVASIGTDGTITFGLGGSGGTFTSSGNKGLPGGWSLQYELG